MGRRSRRQTTDDQIANLVRLKAKKLVRTEEFRDCETADLTQELSLYWLQCRAQFRPERGNILTFADIVLNRHICNLLAARHAAKRDCALCAVSLDDPVDDEDEPGMTRHDVYDRDRYFSAVGGGDRGGKDKDDLRADLSRVLRALPPKLQELALRLPTQTVTGIAADMRVSRETIHAWRQQIRAAFEDAGLADYL